MRRFAGTIALVLAGGAAHAQSAAARLIASGGTATDLRGARSGAYSLAPSLILAARSGSALALGGAVTSYSNELWSAAGRSGLLLRIPVRGGFGLALDAAGELTHASDRVDYFLADLLPALEWRHGGASLWGGARLAASRIEFGDLAGLAGLPLDAGTALGRSSFGPAFGGAYTWIPAVGTSLVLRYREEHGRPDSVPVSDRVAALALSRGRASLGLTLGIRSAPDEGRTYGGVRAAFVLTPAVTLLGAAESYPANRLTGIPAGRAITLGVSLSTSRSGARRGLPAPRGIRPPAPGMTRLSLRAPNAGRVEVAGDWNQWHPAPLARSENGVWYLDLAIPAGVYRYAFRIDGSRWDVPRGVAAVDDGFGGKSAWLTVGEPARTAPQSANRKEES